MEKYNQEDILNYKPIDYKETDIQTYTLNIQSKDRNIIREPNPFNFEIIFNQEQQQNNQRAVIPNKFENIKKIYLSQIIIPRYIPRNYIGEAVTGITPLYSTSSSITLSFYPGININNTILTVLDISGNEKKIEVVELVDLANKKMYIVAQQYNNPYYLTKYITIKAELFSYLNINNEIHPIIDIIGNILILGNVQNYPLPINTNERLILADYYKNTIIVSKPNELKIGITLTTIEIKGGNIKNFQFLYPDQYLEYQINSSESNISNRKLFKVKSITSYLTGLQNTIENTTIKIIGKWVDDVPYNYNDNVNLFYDINNTIKINQFNYGVRDLFEEKYFYLNLSPFVPSKCISTDSNLNNSFGILYPCTPNSTKDYLYLKGDASESYCNVNLQKSVNKIQFSLMDSNNKQIGLIYEKFKNLYNPNNDVSILSYLPFSPEVSIILKIDEIIKKFTNIG
jgi:hypothetical protein